MDYYNIDFDERLDFQYKIRFISSIVLTRRAEEAEEKRKVSLAKKK